MHADPTDLHRSADFDETFREHYWPMVRSLAVACGDREAAADAVSPRRYQVPRDAVPGDRELPAFTCLLDELRKTNLGKNWQPTDAALHELTVQGRKDFLEVLLARRLDLKRGAAIEKLTGVTIKR